MRGSTVAAGMLRACVACSCIYFAGTLTSVKPQGGYGETSGCPIRPRSKNAHTYAATSSVRGWLTCGGWAVPPVGFLPTRDSSDLPLAHPLRRPTASPDRVDVRGCPCCGVRTVTPQCASTQLLRSRAQCTLKRQKPHRGGAPTVLGRTGFLFLGGKRKSCITRLGAGRGYVSQWFGAWCRPHHSRMHRTTKPATASPAPITAVSSQRDTQGNHPPSSPLQIPQSTCAF